jgi:hypothetical protein
MGVVYSTPRIVTDGLVFYINPSDRKCYSSGSTCRDLTRIHGTTNLYNDITFSSDKAFQMDSTISYIYTIRNFTNVSNSTTYIVTAEIPSTLSYLPLLSSWNNSGGIFIYKWTQSGQDKIAALVANDSGSLSQGISYNITPNYPQKKFIALTINGTVLKLYLDGILVSTISHTVGSINSQYAIRLGNGPYSINTVVNTKFYNSLIYNRPLNDNEILENFKGLKGKFNL